MTVSSIKKKKTYEIVIEKLIQMIKDGTIKVGDKLPSERDLSLMFNVSRATLRESMRAMEVIGFVEVHVGEGTYIADLNIVPFIRTISTLFVNESSIENELLDLRQLLESQAVRLIIETGIPNERLNELGAIVEEMRIQTLENDVELGMTADVAFHQKLFELSGNYMLSKVGECICSILESSVILNREKILGFGNNGFELYKQHHKIFLSILEKDEKTAIDTLMQHLRFVKNLA